MVIYSQVLRLPASEHNLIIHTTDNYVNFILNYKKSNNRKSLYVYENIMSDVTKFTEEEMQEIAIVQSKYQQKIFELGQLQLEEIELEQTKTELTDRRSAILIEWKDIQKLIKVDVKTINDHPYPWHSGSPESALVSPEKNSNRSGGAHKSRKSEASKQNKKRWY